MHKIYSLFNPPLYVCYVYSKLCHSLVLYWRQVSTPFKLLQWHTSQISSCNHVQLQAREGVGRLLALHVHLFREDGKRHSLDESLFSTRETLI